MRWAMDVARGANISRTLGFDASPQIGLELFGGLVEAIEGCNIDTMCRLFLTLSVLGFGHMKAVDKLMALAWQIWLLSGPSRATMEAWLGSVRVIITDMGVEAGLADAKCILDIFFDFLRTGSVLEGAQLSDHYFFPHAFLLPGWHHCWSNILKDTCTGIEFFAGWLVEVKAIVELFRPHTVRVAVSACFAWTAAELKALQLFGASFAKWRWHTLYEATLGCLSLQFLARAWEQVMVALASTAEQATLTVVDKALKSPRFWRRTKAMHDLSKRVDKCRRWGAGCSCHEEELRAGRQVDCKYKGRRLKQCSEYIPQVADEFRRRGQSVSLDDVEGDESLLQVMVTAFNFIAGWAMAKFDFFLKLPYLFVRADEQEVCARCIFLYDQVPEDQHHRVSLLF
jgi:hypothetical protein